MPMSERTRPHSLTVQLLLVFLLANLCTTLVAMPTAQKFFREGDGRGIGGGGGGGVRGSGSIPVRRQEAEDVQVVRYFKLLNRCSQKYVRLTSKHIDSRAMLDSIYSQLRVVSEEFGSLLRIQSAQSHSFLCFNKRGKLIVKHLGKDNRCVFREIHTSDHFTEYQSAVNETWFLSFRKTGQAMDAGHEWTRRPGSQRCRQFTKTQFAYLDSANPHQLGHSAKDKSLLPINPSAIDHRRVRLGTPNEGHQSEAGVQRTQIEGHQKETTSKGSPARNHRSEAASRRSTARSHQSEGNKRRSSVIGHQSKDTNQRPPVGDANRRSHLGRQTSEATIPRTPVEGQEPEAT